jgi:hypothetical protein
MASVKLKVVFCWWVIPMLAVLKVLAPILAIAINDERKSQLSSLIGQFVAVHGFRVQAE